MSKQEDEHLKIAKLGLAIVAILVLMLVGWIGSLFGGGDETPQESEATIERAAQREENKAKAKELAEKVDGSLNALDADMRSSLASTSLGGLQGDIIGVEEYSEDGVKVHVSTHFTEAGEENEGGKNIAWKIFNMICRDIPELDSLYVTSDTSGLDSKSVYRSQMPNCQ